jgi:hypothetical protein
MYGTFKLGQNRAKRISQIFTPFSLQPAAGIELSTPCRINSCTSLSLDKGCTFETKATTI